MHVKFPAIVPHDPIPPPTTSTSEPSTSDSSTASAQEPSDQPPKPVPIRAINTKFLALDKVPSIYLHIVQQ